jgi:hypothetical protein
MALPVWAYFLHSCYTDKSLKISATSHFKVPEGEMPIETDCTKYDEQNKQGGIDFIFGNDRNQ